MKKTKVQKQICKQQILMSKQSLSKKHQHHIEIVDQIYNHKFKKYLDYYKIQKSIVRNATSRTFKRARDQLSHINHSYIFLPTTCTSTQDIDLVWDGFSKFQNLIYFNVALLKHPITRFLDLLHFLDSWVVYRKKKGIPLVGPEHITLSCQRLRLGSLK